MSNKGSFFCPKLLTVMKDTLAVWLMKPRDVKLWAFQTDCSVQFHEARVDPLLHHTWQD